MRSLLLLLCLLAGPLEAAELKLIGKAQRDEFVTVASDKAGKWLVIGPTTITVTKAGEVAGVSVGSTSVNFRQTIVGDEGKRCHFVGPPGPYAVIQVVADEDTPSHLVVTIPGKVKPVDPVDPVDPDKPSKVDFKAIVKMPAQGTKAEARQIAGSFRNAANVSLSSYKAYDDELQAQIKSPDSIGLARYLTWAEVLAAVRAAITKTKPQAADVPALYRAAADAFEQLGG